MNPMERADHAPEEFARNLAEQRARMEEAGAFIHYAHSRTGLPAHFLRRMANGIDSTGEAGRAAV
jgi:hypothetical protein